MLVMSSSTDATPMLTDTLSCSPARSNGSSNAPRMRSMIAVAVSRSPDVLAQDHELVATETRQRVARRAAPAAAAAATCFNNSSPVWWPNVSFTSLNRLRSRNITTGAAPPRRRISFDRVVEAVDEELAIRQPGQPVVQRLVREQRLDLLLGLAGRAGHADRDREHERAEEADRHRVRDRHEGRRPAERGRGLADRATGERPTERGAPGCARPTVRGRRTRRTRTPCRAPVPIPTCR